MRISDFCKVPYALARQPSLVRCPSQYVFVVSHMRSRSTLLSHILGSHPEICGYLENHQSYRSAWDLLRLKAKLRWAHSESLRAPWALDKLLHNRRQIAPAIVRRENVRILLMLRKPEQTLPSIVATERRRRPDFSLQSAADYYEQRVQQLGAWAAAASDHVAFLESDEIVQSPPTMLAGLTQFLRLNSPLREEYQLFPLSGQVGLGDPSQVLKTQRIMRAGDAGASAESLPEALLAPCRDAYLACLDAWRRHCRSIEFWARARPAA